MYLMQPLTHEIGLQRRFYFFSFLLLLRLIDMRLSSFEEIYFD